MLNTGQFLMKSVSIFFHKPCTKLRWILDMLHGHQIHKYVGIMSCVKNKILLSEQLLIISQYIWVFGTKY